LKGEKREALLSPKYSSESPMNLNDQEFTIDAGRNYNLESHRNIDFFSFNEFKKSSILLRPINGAGVIVEAASRKPK
jgi:hypothetical protein